MWKIQDKIVLNQKREFERKENLVVNMHQSLGIYKFMYYYQHRDIFIGSTNTNHLVFYVDECKTPVLMYLQKDVIFNALEFV